MKLADLVHERCDEFFEAISNKELNENQDLQQEIEDLRILVARWRGKWFSDSPCVVVDSLISKLDEIWSLISVEEKCQNLFLEDQYTILRQMLDGIY